MSTVAVVGLGAMGGRIAHRLIDAGHDVVVWNRTADRMSPVADRGALPAESPASAAREAAAVISGEYPQRFALALARKDAELVMEAATAADPPGT